TSMTAVGAIAGMGIATGSLNWAVMGRIVSWWFVAPVIAFWAGAVLGRYLYPHLNSWFVIDQSDGPLLVWRSEFPYIKRGEGTTRRELMGSIIVLCIGCFMAFSAGASNVANAVAPLVGNNTVSMGNGILLAVMAIGVGAFTLGRRTLETVGRGLTEMPLLAAILVSIVSASIITTLSWMGIPASLALSSTMCIAGLGWGRASRTMSLSDTIQGEAVETAGSIEALMEEPGSDVGPIGEEDPENLRATGKELFDPDTISRIVILWILTPSLSASASYLIFLVLL
ncbi:MAG: inorganic phosphate transporter, partial [Candidatus Nanohaloarchaea archaeon]|nr:inorganic phosphate transporter [Candidatus Nanohaloarchaea archaeon]